MIGNAETFVHVFPSSFEYAKSPAVSPLVPTSIFPSADFTVAGFVTASFDTSGAVRSFFAMTSVIVMAYVSASVRNFAAALAGDSFVLSVPFTLW